MTAAELTRQILDRQSYLCVGLDTDERLIPNHLKGEKDAVLTFNKAIIEHTAEFAVAYKPNLAFYETLGPRGLDVLQATLELIPPGKLTIADAKRGDIGNTARRYARAYFETYGFDAVTVAPYMGHDSVQPFLEYPGKWAIVLGVTSNEGALDFQFLPTGVPPRPLFEKVVQRCATWGSLDNLMFVAGATRPEVMQQLRAVVPDHFLLVPGVGAQGGNLQEVARAGMNSRVGLLVNASRSILYASSNRDFDVAAGKAAQTLHNEMKLTLEEKGLS